MKMKGNLRHQAEKQPFHIRTVGLKETHVEDYHFLQPDKNTGSYSPTKHRSKQKKGEDVRNRK